MLKGLSPLLSADLLHALASMGHGDDIVLADANFPSATHAKRLIRMPGIGAAQVLEAVLSVIPLDTFVDAPALTMQVVGDETAVPVPVSEFARLLTQHGESNPESLERFAYYELARSASVIVQTGDLRKYANILLRKGVISVD
jgi:L-fucose mutarotase